MRSRRVSFNGVSSLTIGAQDFCVHSYDNGADRGVRLVNLDDCGGGNGECRIAVSPLAVDCDRRARRCCDEATNASAFGCCVGGIGGERNGECDRGQCDYSEKADDGERCVNTFDLSVWILDEL